MKDRLEVKGLNQLKGTVNGQRGGPEWRQGEKDEEEEGQTHTSRRKLEDLAISWKKGKTKDRRLLGFSCN